MTSVPTAAPAEVLARGHAGRVPLSAGATVAVVGGGPAGAFFALQLLRRAAARGVSLRVKVFERRHQPTANTGLPECWKGCNHCAGGISPRLHDSLGELGLTLPEGVIQRHIRSVTIQGDWKNIAIEVPAHRRMCSVYRGSRPSRRPDPENNFDGFLLRAAEQAGAEIVAGEVSGVARAADGRPVVRHSTAAGAAELTADLLVLAAGVNGKPGLRTEENPIVRMARELAPGYVPTRLRRALIFEMELDATQPAWLDEELHFVEYGSPALPLEMCSLVPKRGFLTAVLVGRAVDRATGPDAARRVMREFLALPHIRMLVPPRAQLRLACTCSPNMVVGTARNPFGERVAIVGDLATSRLYKDGLLSAQRLAAALADTVLEHGVDAASLARGYGPAVEAFRRDNRFAAAVFLLHRVVFSSAVLSRFLYQAAILERKELPAGRRRIEGILWQVASGDAPYEQVFRAMSHPATLWAVLRGGVAVTLRNWVAEVVFGLRWRGLGRFTTGVALERLEAKRAQFAQWLASFHLPVPGHFEFERMYTIRIRAPRGKVFAELGRFGEPDRGYLHPRWVRIQRVAGVPNAPGCAIEYRVVLGRFSFRLELEHVVADHLAVYRVQNGFARGGVLIFELEPGRGDTCDVSIYVAFNFPRGRGPLPAVGWWLYRHLFPAFVHDVIWNHSLCQLKDGVEKWRQQEAPVLQESESHCQACSAHA